MIKKNCFYNFHCYSNPLVIKIVCLLSKKMFFNVYKHGKNHLVTHMITKDTFLTILVHD